MMAALSLVLDASVAMVGTAAALVALLSAPLAPRWAITLAGVTVAGNPTSEAADLARGHLAGLTLGVAAVAAGGAVLAATGVGWWGASFSASACAVLALRGRGFAEPLPARAQQVAAVLGAAGVAAVVPATPALRLALLTVGLGALLVVATNTRPRPGPVARRAVDLAEWSLTALCVPLAAAALGLFTLVRGW
jgi:hypothetical protein